MAQAFDSSNNPSAELPSDRFEHRIEVRAGDIDVNGHANNVVYVRWIQDAAVAHWFAVVDPEVAKRTSWAVVRHEVDYKRPALEGDSLVARTWVGAISAATCERFCEIVRREDPVVLARSRTLWCVFDPVSGRPKRIDPAVLSVFRGQKSTDSPSSPSGSQPAGSSGDS